MEDQSYLDKKYFIDKEVYNCPFCNRNNVLYKITRYFKFDWSGSKECYAIFVKCSSCDSVSLHLSFEKIIESNESLPGPKRLYYSFVDNIDIDSNIFYSVPTSFFVIDNRIPRLIRELITEAEGCLKMNYLTGSSACMRKAIYELLINEELTNGNYEDKIKSLKSKYPNSDPVPYNILSHIQEMTSDKIHEQSWDEWDSDNLHLIIETLKNVLYEIYVLPREKDERAKKIKDLHQKSKSKKINAGN